VYIVVEIVYLLNCLAEIPTSVELLTLHIRLVGEVSSDQTTKWGEMLSHVLSTVGWSKTRLVE